MPLATTSRRSRSRHARGAAAAAIAVAVSVVLAACSGGGSVDSAETSNEPGAGGTLRVAILGDGNLESNDTLTANTTSDYLRIHQIFEPLTVVDPEKGVQPYLAEHLEANADATEWTITLKDGVRFSDGTPLSADDAVFTLRMHQAPDSGSVVSGLLASVVAIDKIDDLTFTVSLASPNSYFDQVLSNYHFGIVKDGTTDFDDPVGTGPFVLDRFVPGRRASWSRTRITASRASPTSMNSSSSPSQTRKRGSTPC